MSDISNAPAGGAEQSIASIASTPADTRPLTPSEAGRALAARRVEKAKEQQAAPEPVPQEQAPVETPQELPETASDAQPEADPVETTNEAEPAELPPIEPPRSWTKEDKEEFASYPREAQEKIARREQERERTFRQSQNEAAEQRKAIEAKAQDAEKVRQEYEARLPVLLQTLQETQAGQFADIKTQADVVKLAQEDPFRYLQWDAHQKQVAALNAELNGAQERQQREWQNKWAEFALREDKLIAEKIPELADPAQRTKVQESALSYLKDTGFSESELGSAWNGQASLSLRDHRVQSMIRDAVKFREGQENAKKAIAAKPLPPVQRPGVAAPKGAADTQNVQNLSRKLDQSGNLKDAAALLIAKRRAAR